VNLEVHGDDDGLFGQCEECIGLEDERDTLHAKVTALEAEMAVLKEQNTKLKARGDCQACADGFPCERSD
jgi:hypothetical protein